MAANPAINTANGRLKQFSGSLNITNNKGPFVVTVRTDAMRNKTPIDEQVPILAASETVQVSFFIMNKRKAWTR